MRKGVIIIFVLLALVLFAFLRFGNPMLGIVSGYTAKNMCSCVFVAGMDKQRVIEEDLNFSLLGLATPKIDEINKKVTSSVFGFQEKTAIYRDYLGCALVSEGGKSSLYSHGSDWEETRYDSLLNWFEIRDSLSHLTSDQEEKINEIVSSAFIETEGKQKNTRAAVILHKGKIIAEKYAEGFNKDSRLLGWSMTKSLTSTMFGLMQRDDMLNLNDPPMVESWSEDERSKISWKHLLQMSGGLKWAEVYSFVSDATLMLYESDNMGAYAESLPAEHPAGEEWLYSSGTSNIIAYNLAHSFKNLDDYQSYLYKEFYNKIGAYSMLMETDASGYFVGSSYSWATARDWARIGQVYLQDGQWDGEQVVPQEWIDFVRTPVEASGKDYGGHFWLNAGLYLPDVPADVYSLNGFQGQRIYIVPSTDLVIVRLGLTYKRGDFDFNKWVSEIVNVVEKG